MAKKPITVAIAAIYGSIRPTLEAAWHWEIIDGIKMMPTPILVLGPAINRPTRRGS
jgi:hypothetical protein